MLRTILLLLSFGLFMPNFFTPPAQAGCRDDQPQDIDVRDTLRELSQIRKGEVIPGSGQSGPGIRISDQITALKDKARLARTQFCRTPPAITSELRRGFDMGTFVGRPETVRDVGACDRYAFECRLGAFSGGDIDARVQGLQAAAEAYIMMNEGDFRPSEDDDPPQSNGATVLAQLNQSRCAAPVVQSSLAKAAALSSGLSRLTETEETIREMNDAIECTVVFDETFFRQSSRWRDDLIAARDAMANAYDIYSGYGRAPVIIEACTPNILSDLDALVGAGRAFEQAGWQILDRHGELFVAAGLYDIRSRRAILVPAFSAGGVLTSAADLLTDNLLEMDGWLDGMENQKSAVEALPTACPLSDADERALVGNIRAFFAGFRQVDRLMTEIATDAVDMNGFASQLIPGAYSNTTSDFQTTFRETLDDIGIEIDDYIVEEMPIVRSLLTF